MYLLGASLISLSGRAFGGDSAGYCRPRACGLIKMVAPVGRARPMPQLIATANLSRAHSGLRYSGVFGYRRAISGRRKPPRTSFCAGLAAPAMLRDKRAAGSRRSEPLSRNCEIVRSRRLLRARRNAAVELRKIVRGYTRADAGGRSGLIDCRERGFGVLGE